MKDLEIMYYDVIMLMTSQIRTYNIGKKIIIQKCVGVRGKTLLNKYAVKQCGQVHKGEKFVERCGAELEKIL